MDEDPGELHGGKWSGLVGLVPSLATRASRRGTRLAGKVVRPVGRSTLPANQNPRPRCAGRQRRDGSGGTSAREGSNEPLTGKRIR
jgi:hypothetical protein